MLRRTPHKLKKSRLVSIEHISEGGANSELDKDTDRSNFNSKVKHPSLALPLNILFLLLVFIGFNCCNVRFGIACFIITIIIVQVIVTVGLLFAWSQCMYLS